VIAAFLAHVARDPHLPKLLLLPLIARQGSFAETLDRVIARYGWRSAGFGEHERALLLPGRQSAYLDQAVSAKRRKELRRQRHRLDDIAPVRIANMTEPCLIGAGLDEFLALEARGWKGRAGTAAAEHEATYRFMASALAALAAEDKARIDRLLLGERAIAASILLRSGSGGWFWKIAYDEAFARYSPGVQLTLALTESLIGDPAIAQVDSCATPDHQMIDHLWRERLTLVDRLVATDVGVGFTLACRLEDARRTVISLAKAARDVIARR
jgi:hypothetical protein